MSHQRLFPTLIQGFHQVVHLNSPLRIQVAVFQRRRLFPHVHPLAPLAPPLPSNRPQTDDVLSTDGIPESAPPAYSVTPNVGGGERVL